MKTSFFKIILAYVLFFINHLIVFSQPTDCVPNSGETSTIVFGPNVNPTLNGNPLPVGTYIVAVYNSPTCLKCAGYSQWSNAAFGLSPFGATTGFAGYAVGEIYKYRLELPGGIIIPNSQINVTYKSPDGLVCSDGSSYKTNGVSCIESFNAVNSTSSDTQISIIGDVFSQGQWIDDYFLDQSSTNPDLWTKTYKLKKGEVKFRKNMMWETNWGGSTFPSGAAEPDGPNIIIPLEGNYNISFNLKSLNYSFNFVSSSYNPLIESKLNLYPNPTTGIISVELDVKGLKNLEVRSLDGRLIQALPALKDNTIDLSHLAPGSYILKGFINNYPFAKKVVIVR